MFYENFVNACQQNNTTPTDVQKQLGIPRPTMSSWKHSGATPRSAMVEKIASHLKIEPSKLIDGKPSDKKPEKKDPVEQKSLLLDAFNTLNPRGQKIAVSRLKELNQIQRYTA